MHLTTSAATHRGRRTQNEDAYWADPERGVFALADGMGGRRGGAMASSLAVRAAAQTTQRGRRADGIGVVRAAIRRANALVHARRKGRNAEMGSTLAMLYVHDGSTVIGHVGDSRVYRLRDGRMNRMTRDHDFYAKLQEAGAGLLPERRRLPSGNVLTRIVGWPDRGAPDIRVDEACTGDLFLLCSDGLSDVLDDLLIAEILMSAPLRCAASRLVELALRAGADDNITALVVRLAAGEAGSKSRIPLRDRWATRRRRIRTPLVHVPAHI